MERIGVRELRQHASRYLDLVKRGETVEVTERGKLIARLVPPAESQTTRERLIADGRLVPARHELRLPEPVRPPNRAGSTEEILESLREERL